MQHKVTVLYGKNKFLLNKKLNEIIKTTEIKDFNITTYSLLEESINEVLEDLITISFFSEEKVIVIKDLEELLKLDESYINRFISYLKNPNPDVYLFILLDNLINKNYPLGKALANYAYISEISDLKPTEFNEYIVSSLKENNFSIENQAVLELILRTNYNLDLLEQELEKLITYNLDSKLIKLEDVLALVSKNLEENIYELVNHLLLNENKKTISIFYDLMERNEDPLRIINNISNKLRQILHTKLLLDKNKSKEEISDYLKTSPNQTYYVLKDSKKYEYSKLEQMLDDLSNLDLKIKSGKLDKRIGLEMFILGN